MRCFARHTQGSLCVCFTPLNNSSSIFERCAETFHLHPEASGTAAGPPPGEASVKPGGEVRYGNSAIIFYKNKRPYRTADLAQGASRWWVAEVPQLREARGKGEAWNLKFFLALFPAKLFTFASHIFTVMDPYPARINSVIIP